MAKQLFLPKLKQREFNEEFFELCKVFNKRVRKDFDCVGAITGEEGISKSTLANQIGFHCKMPYDLEKNVLYSPSKQELEGKIKDLPRFSVINADEAIKILYKQQWYTPLQIYINKLYRMCRQENKITLLCMPRFYEFNEGFRNHRIKVWIHVIDRGLALVFMKDWSAFVKDPWWFDENQRMIDKYRRGKKFLDFSFGDQINVYKKSRNYVSVITFPDLSEKLRIKYKELSSAHKYEGLETEYAEGVRYTKLRDRYKIAMRKAVIALKEQGLAQEDIAKKLGFSPAFVSETLSKASQFTS